MNENEILATRQVQADGLNGKDAKETKQLQTVWGRSPNPAPDCFFVFYKLVRRLGCNCPDLFFFYSESAKCLSHKPNNIWGIL